MRAHALQLPHLAHELLVLIFHAVRLQTTTITYRHRSHTACMRETCTSRVGCQQLPSLPTSSSCRCCAALRRLLSCTRCGLSGRLAKSSSACTHRHVSLTHYTCMASGSSGHEWSSGDLSAVLACMSSLGVSLPERSSSTRLKKSCSRMPAATTEQQPRHRPPSQRTACKMDRGQVSQSPPIRSCCHCVKEPTRLSPS